MPHDFTKLLEPGRIGPVRTRNRIIKTANGTSYIDEDQNVGERMIAYYARLAKGGVGYLTVESCGVEYPEGIQHVHYDSEGNLIGGVQLHIDDDRYLPGFRKLSEVIHSHGCPCSVQLQHAGPWNPTGLLPKRRTRCSSTFTREELPGPDFAPVIGMTHEEVEEQIEIWISAAVRVWKAGFDAVEINHGTCHEGNTFLSRVWNKRTDEFGAQSFENRTRFMRRIVEGVKERTSPNFAVTVLFNIAEFRHPLGTTIEEGSEMARLIAESGADGINCRAHSYGHRGGLIQPDRILYPEPPEDLPQELDWSQGGKGATVPLVEAVKRKVKNIPVWTACRLDPELGEEYLRKGRLDFVGMTRRLLADPELPNKVAEGRLEDIRQCHGCLHCFDVRNKNGRLECRINATLGRETDPAFTFTPAERKKKVLVVGGGPAGMEAARVAAKRGHEVELYEKGTSLGGLIPMAAVVKDLETEDLAVYVRYLVTQLKKEGVSVHLGREVDEDALKKESPDVLVIAAGARHVNFDVPGGSSRKVLPGGALHEQLKFWLRFFSPTQIQKLTRLYMPIGKRVAIVGGTLHGCELAEFLTKRGRQVTILHDGPREQLGEGMIVDDLMNLWPWFEKKGVSILTGVKYERVTKDGLVVSTGEGKEITLEVDSVITTQDLVPNTKLFERLKGLVPTVYIIGSSNEPGLIVDAVKDGAKIGYAI